MGLDQYLTKSTYVKNWDHQKPEERHKFFIAKGDQERTDIKPERITSIKEEIMYWRKANQIHKWFVDNVQSGIDDCGDYYVEPAKLKTLFETCEKVIAGSNMVKGKIKNGRRTFINDAGERVTEDIMEDGTYIENPKLARQLLPVQSGFFFGGTEYDEYYMADVINTRDKLKELFEEPDWDKGDYYYHSSW